MFLSIEHDDLTLITPPRSPSPAPPLPPPPRLAHTLHHEQKCSVLALAADRKHVFGACQAADIHVWDRETFQIKTTLQGHTGSVLALEIARDREWLFSSSGDSTVRIWNTHTLTPLYVLTPHLDTSAGDIFSLCWSPTLQTLYFGCQNTSLQWYDFSRTKPRGGGGGGGHRTTSRKPCESARNGHVGTPPPSDFDPHSRSHSHSHSQSQSHESPDDYLDYFGDGDADSLDSDLGLHHKKWHPFFNNTPRFGPKAYQPLPAQPLTSTNASSLSLPTTGTSTPQHHPRLLQVSPQNIVHAAHYGYIYCMAVLPSPLDGVAWTGAAGVRRNGVRTPPSMVAGEEDTVLLITGSGDETVKVWACSNSLAAAATASSSTTMTTSYPPPANANASAGAILPLQQHPPHGVPVLRKTFTCNQGGGGVLSLVVRDGTVYAGCQDGCVAVWDLETGVLVRMIMAQENSDVLTISMMDTDLYTCCANGWIQRWNAQFLCTAAWKAHGGIVLSSIVTAAGGESGGDDDERESGRGRVGGGEEEAEEDREDRERGWYLVTGANDNDIKIWSIEHPSHATSSNYFPTSSYQTYASDLHDPLVQALSTFVSFPSISNSATHREDCRQAAMWLRRYLGSLGGEAKMMGTMQGFNPLVLATFKGVTPLRPGQERRPRILFYGHYDVISAPKRLWNTEPFSLTGTNGYLYGRGISDNKGPILAVAHAASDLLRRRLLGVDVVFVVEGEEEAGSKGFEEAVRRWRAEEREQGGGEVDAVLISNSYWIGEDTPCITYGLRGVVHATVEIGSGGADLHSGVEGGGAHEPMGDMVRILAGLADGLNVLIPGFYDKVRPQSRVEQDLYALLSNLTQTPPEKFASRWREPSLSIHSVEPSGPGNTTVIPATVRAKVSLRIVPDQDYEAIGTSLVEHVKACFAKLGSSNRLNVRIDRTADWWLGDLESRYFKALEDAITKEWGVVPLRIREGGSIPSIPFLEKEFGCPGLHLPMGQSSDQAHLPNERISLTNLRKGRSVMERFLMAIAGFSSSPARR